MLITVAPILAAFFVRGGLTFPYPLTNTTQAANGTNPNTTLPLPGNQTVPQYNCESTYPSDLTVLDQRYPDYNDSHLHSTQRFFRLRREVDTDGEIATRVQFLGLPAASSNETCRLEFLLPDLTMQRIAGFNPTFNVYQVEAQPGTIVTWNMYQANSNAVLFGRVNGEPEALDRTRAVGGVAAINETRCNETMTFQMGMAFNSRGGVPNYWEFRQIALPAWPQQGFRVVYGC
jgi:hypothetical protein